MANVKTKFQKECVMGQKVQRWFDSFWLEKLAEWQLLGNRSLGESGLWEMFTKKKNKQTQRLLSYFLRSLLSTLNVKWRVSLKLSNLLFFQHIKHIPTTGSLCLLATLLGMLFTHIHWACSFTLSDLCLKVTLTILHKTVKSQYTTH